MDDISLSSDQGAASPSGLLDAIAQGRRQAREYLVRQQRRLGELDAVLAHEVGQVSQQLALSHQAHLDAQSELAQRRGELDEATNKLRLDERGLAQLRRECEANAEELTWQRQRVRHRMTEVDAQRDELDRLEMDLKRRRRRLAHELKARREDDLRKIERCRRELDHERLTTDEREALTRQLAAATQRAADLEQRLAAAGQRQLSAEAEQGLREELADMKRRSELAMDDLHEQKRRVAELEQQPARKLPASPLEDSGKLDWESQKQRLLAALEADDGGDEDDEQRREERLKMRDVVAQTDQALAAKDEQIAELERLLAAQSASIGEVAVGAAAVADVLSADDVVRNERERLQHLQQEWEEKLRQAEIELSVQRAKLARERAEIEERQRSLREKPDHGHPDTADGMPAVKNPRGRWLTRLGLKDDES